MNIKSIDFKDNLLSFSKKGGPLCGLAYIASWIFLAIMIYYGYNIFSSYTISYIFYYILLGIVMMHTYKNIKNAENELIDNITTTM